MIPRYSRKELVHIWSEENKYKIWLDVEIAAAQAMEKYKLIPKGVASVVKKKGKIKVKRIHDIELKVKHHVIEFKGKDRSSFYNKHIKGHCPFS